MFEQMVLVLSFTVQQMCGLTSLRPGGCPVNYSDEKTMGVTAALKASYEVTNDERV